MSHAFATASDINATCIGDFVAAVELFNKVNGTNYDGIITPTETVVFDSRQIKSADKNIGLFDPNNPNVKYSIGIRQYGNNTAQRSDFISDRVKELVKDSEYERDTNAAQVKRATERMDNLGGAEADLVANGGNMNLAEAGTYVVELYTERTTNDKIYCTLTK